MSTITKTKKTLSNVSTKLDKVMNKVKSKKNELGNFMNKKGVNKQKARDLMVTSILNSLVHGIILTLPFEDCIIEQMLLKVSNKFKFLGCEIKENVYNNMLMTIAKKNLPISTHKGSISEIINFARENQFSDLILDYCGQFGTTYKDLETAIKNDIVCVGGCICLTVNKRISPGTEYIYELMEKLNPQPTSNEDTRCEHAIRTFINRKGGEKYAIENALPYHDTTAMLLVVIRRVA
jgi:hypothetical protein